MNVISVLSIWPLLVIAVLLVTGGLVFYALRTMGYVRAKVSHGRTLFELEAKERKASRPVLTRNARADNLRLTPERRWSNDKFRRQ
jgi:hypothetical protein